MGRAQPVASDVPKRKAVVKVKNKITIDWKNKNEIIISFDFTVVKFFHHW